MAQSIFCHGLKQTVVFSLVLPVSWQMPPCSALCSCLQGSGLALPGGTGLPGTRAWEAFAQLISTSPGQNKELAAPGPLH